MNAMTFYERSAFARNINVTMCKCNRENLPWHLRGSGNGWSVYLHEKRKTFLSLHCNALLQLKTFLYISLLSSILYCEHIDKTGSGEGPGKEGP